MGLQWCITISHLVASDKTSADMIERNGGLKDCFCSSPRGLYAAMEEPVVSLVLSLLLLFTA